MAVIQDTGVRVINRALWRLPYPNGPYQTDMVIPLVSGFLALPLFFSDHRSTVAAATSTATVLTGWISVRAGFVGKSPGSRDVTWLPENDIPHTRWHETEANLLGIRSALGAASLGAIGIGLWRLDTIAPKITTSKMALFEWAALLLNVADLGYWQVHSGKFKNHRFAWI